MDESILNSIKKILGIPKDYTVFDPDIIMHINTVFMILNQLGIGPEEGFSIADNAVTWSDYLEDEKRLDSVKTYMGARVRLMFDPPQSSVVMETSKRIIDELEWRIKVQSEYINATE